jgi:MFS family permease
LSADAAGSGREDAVGRQDSLFSRDFTLVCLATGFFYLSFYLILPVMPLYVAGLGGTSTQIGLIIGLFASVAMVLRPPAGWLIDARGTRPVLLAGMSVFLLSSLGYLFTSSVTPILALRLFHGMGMGLFPTAATVIIAELAPPLRRGEAMGWFGIANSIAFIAGPAGGLVVVKQVGYVALFLLAAGVAALGLLCVFLLPKIRRDAPSRVGLPRLGDVFSRAAFLPSAILVCLYLPYGILIAFIPLIATSRGLDNPGLFYTVYAVAMLVVRAKAGEISDRRGRAIVILPGMLCAALAMIILGGTSGSIGVLVGAAAMGVGFGAVQPALMALTTDRVTVAERGKAMGTFYFAWELGIAGGSTGAGILLTTLDAPVLLLGGALLPIAGALLTLKVRQPAPSSKES